MGKAFDRKSGFGSTGKPLVTLTKRYSTGKEGRAGFFTWMLYSFL